MTKITNGDEQIFACMKCNFSGTRQEAFIHATLNMGHGDYIYRSSKGEPPSVEQRIKELLPDSFYADRTVEFRVKMLVESWKRLIRVNRSARSARWTFGLFTFCIGIILGATLHHFGIF